MRSVPGDPGQSVDRDATSTPASRRPRGPGAVEAWLRRHADLTALALVILALILRLHAAAGTFLNADEALHFLIANQPDLSVVYRCSLTNAHPPLYYVVLHFWQQVGDGEVALRLLSVLAGAATVWIVYRWLAAFSPAWGLAAALLFAVLPSLVALTAEVRGYALLMLFMAGSLLTLERATARGSAGAMIGSGLLLCGAVLTHYSAPFFAASLGLVGLLQVASTRSGRRFTLAWLAAQASAVALLVFLLLTHVSRIRGSGMDQEAHATWLRGYFFDRGHDDLLRFVVGRTGGVFFYLFGSKAAAVVALLLFVAGVGLALGAWARGKSAAGGGRYLGGTAALAFALTCAGAVAGVFPYGNTRHIAFLALFAVPVACLPVARVTRGRVGASLLIGAAAAAGIHGAARPADWGIARASQRRELMEAAIATLRQHVPPGGAVLVDYQTSLLLAYYLRDGGVGPFPEVGPELVEIPVGRLRMLVWAAWDFTPDSLATALGRVADTGRARPGRPLWVMDAGWGPRLAAGAATFGDNIALFPVEVPRRPEPATTGGPD